MRRAANGRKGPPPDSCIAVIASYPITSSAIASTPGGSQRAPAGHPQGRALYKRRAPDVEGLHASLKDNGGLRRFSLRGLHNATSEFLFAGLAHNLRLLTAVS